MQSTASQPARGRVVFNGHATGGLYRSSDVAVGGSGIEKLSPAPPFSLDAHPAPDTPCCPQERQADRGPGSQQLGGVQPRAVLPERGMAPPGHARGGAEKGEPGGGMREGPGEGRAVGVRQSDGVSEHATPPERTRLPNRPATLAACSVLLLHPLAAPRCTARANGSS